MVGLLEIRDSVQKISEAIASVLNMDVIISDAEFRKIGDTKKHFNLEVKYIKDDGEGLVTGDIESTIANIGRMGGVGMRSTDSEILKIMVDRESSVS